MCGLGLVLKYATNIDESALFIFRMDDSNYSDLCDLTSSFGEYSCGDDDDAIIVYQNAQKTKCTNPTTLMVNEILLDKAKNNNSYAAASEQMKRLNSVPGALLEYPVTKSQMKREANLIYDYDRYLFCRTHRSVMFKEGETCGICGKKTKKTKNNYFVYISIKQQIIHILDKYVNVILQYVEEERVCGEIYDIYDSAVYKTVAEKSADKVLLPMTINLDGAKIFKSSTFSLWPIQVTLGFLPPNIRFLPENVLVVGLFCGEKKPDMYTIIAPFANEMKMLKQKGIHHFQENRLVQFEPTVLFCAADIPARAEIQNCKTSAGYHGCPCCHQKGESVKNPKTMRSYVRFLSVVEKAPLRTHNEAIKLGESILNRKPITETNGLKGISCMIAFKDFDLANGYPIDYMHGACLGITAVLLDIWTGKKKMVYEESEKYNFKALSRKQQLELNRRIISLKPTTQMSHKPRTILDRSTCTANEYRSLLLFYLRFSLSGLISKQLIKHFALLSDAIYMLSMPRIKKSDVLKAGDMLNKFADQFQVYYGKNSVTINLHLLRHYAVSVLNSGPLWCHSMFTFEAKIGELKRSFNCNVDVVEQIALNYCIKADTERAESTEIELTPTIIRPSSTKEIKTEYENAVIAAGFDLKDIQFWGYEMQWKRKNFKTTSSLVTKSIDYFLEMKDGSIGKAELFLRFEKTYVLIRIYDVVKVYNHLKLVKPSQTEIHRIFSCDEIRRKLLYLTFTYSNVSFVDIVTAEPNPFEGN